MAAQKGNPSLWSGTPFCRLKMVRPFGNSIGETPAAFTKRARAVIKFSKLKCYLNRF
jgi:hypothetical protein